MLRWLLPVSSTQLLDKLLKKLLYQQKTDLQNHSTSVPVAAIRLCLIVSERRVRWSASKIYIEIHTYIHLYLLKNFQYNPTKTKGTELDEKAETLTFAHEQHNYW